DCPSPLVLRAQLLMQGLRRRRKLLVALDHLKILIVITILQMWGQMAFTVGHHRLRQAFSRRPQQKAFWIGTATNLMSFRLPQDGLSRLSIEASWPRAVMRKAFPSSL